MSNALDKSRYMLIGIFPLSSSSVTRSINSSTANSVE